MEDNLLTASRAKYARYQELTELLEYPEIQSDKGYYLSILTEYNAVRDLASCLDRYDETERELTLIDELIASADDEEKKRLLAEKREIYRQKTFLRSKLYECLRGSAAVTEKADACIRGDAGCGGAVEKLFLSVQAYLLSRDLTVTNVKRVLSSKDEAREIAFSLEGADAYATIYPFLGQYAVKASAGKPSVRFCAFLREDAPEPSDNEFRISLYHSGGAGGQNINKVETAVRVTHEKTGIVTTCQDERSQLKNKNRALATAKERIKAFYAAQTLARDQETERLLLSPSPLKRTLTERTFSLGGSMRAEYDFPLSVSDAQTFADELRLHERL